MTGEDIYFEKKIREENVCFTDCDLRTSSGGISKTCKHLVTKYHEAPGVKLKKNKQLVEGKTIVYNK